MTSFGKTPPWMDRLVTLTRYLLTRPDTRATVAGGPRPLVVCAGDWTGAPHRWYRADTLLAAIESAVVDRATAVGEPVTRDGRPIVPGLDLWYVRPSAGGAQCVRVGDDLDLAWWQFDRAIDGDGWGGVRMGYADCWSTRAAAVRAAAAGPRPRSGRGRE